MKFPSFLFTIWNQSFLEHDGVDGWMSLTPVEYQNINFHFQIYVVWRQKSVWQKISSWPLDFWIKNLEASRNQDTRELTKKNTCAIHMWKFLCKFNSQYKFVSNPFFELKYRVTLRFWKGQSFGSKNLQTLPLSEILCERRTGFFFNSNSRWTLDFVDLQNLSV